MKNIVFLLLIAVFCNTKSVAQKIRSDECFIVSFSTVPVTETQIAINTVSYEVGGCYGYGTYLTVPEPRKKDASNVATMYTDIKSSKEKNAATKILTGKLRTSCLEKILPCTPEVLTNQLLRVLEKLNKEGKLTSCTQIHFEFATGYNKDYWQYRACVFNTYPSEPIYIGEWTTFLKQ